jgi:hypothetical protein
MWSIQQDGHIAIDAQINENHGVYKRWYWYYSVMYLYYNGNNIREARRQQQPSPSEFSQSQAASMPGTIALQYPKGMSYLLV